MIKPPRFDAQTLAEIERWLALYRSEGFVLEIGCGVGFHPLLQSRLLPARPYLALERTREKFEKFRTRFEAEGATSALLPVHADAVPFVVTFVRPGMLQGLYLLYPNPERKNAAARWILMPFFKFLIDQLRPGAFIEVRTNVPEYIREFREKLVEFYGDQFSEVSVESILPTEKNIQNSKTHFERKYLLRGETCFLLRTNRRVSGTEVR